MSKPSPQSIAGPTLTAWLSVLLIPAAPSASASDNARLEALERRLS